MKIVFLLLLVSVTLILNFRRKVHRIDSTLGRVDKMAAALHAQSIYIRSLARTTLGLKRLYRQRLEQRDRLVTRCNDITELVAKTSHYDCRLHVIDERRAGNDNGWVALVTHHNFKRLVEPEVVPEFDRQWKVGRRFIVWANDRDRATDKIYNVFPKEKGFQITSLEPESEALQ